MECSQSETKNIVVFQSDFGTENSAVASMYGVAESVSPTLKLYNLTHKIPAFDIWVASLTLSEVIEYWPTGTVFVSVVDPGVGTDRLSVVAKTKSGHYVVTPDNGTLTFVQERYGILHMREINEAVNRRANSENSYTFHGRDVYAYVGARLASGAISFEEVGRKLNETSVMLPRIQAKRIGKNIFEGTIDLIDRPYGNVWTNIPRELFLSDGIAFNMQIKVSIWNGEQLIYQANMPYLETFGEAQKSNALLYINSQYKVSLALNMGDFATTHDIDYGQTWRIRVEKLS